MREIVGKIQGYDVIYIPEKDLLFCKNTTIPYQIIKDVLIDNPVDRVLLKKDVEMVSDKGSVQFACLETSLENCKEINKNIKKVKNGWKVRNKNQ